MLATAAACVLSCDGVRIPFKVLFTSKIVQNAVKHLFLDGILHSSECSQHPYVVSALE